MSRAFRVKESRPGSNRIIVCLTMKWVQSYDVPETESLYLGTKYEADASDEIFGSGLTLYGQPTLPQCSMPIWKKLE